MSSTVVTIIKGMKGKKRIKTKIGVGSVVKANVAEMEANKREGRIGRMRKEVMGCSQDVVSKNILLFQFRDGQKKFMSYISLVFLSLKEEVEMDEPLSNFPQNKQGELLIIERNNEVG